MLPLNTYKNLLGFVASISWNLSTEGEMINPQSDWEEFTGQTWEEYKGKGWLAAVHSDDIERVKVSIEESNIIKNVVFEDQLRIFNRKEGRYNLLLVRAIPVYKDDGELDQWFGICINLQQLKDKEEAAKFNEARYRRLSDLSEEGVCVSKDYRIIEANKAFCRLFGYEEDEMYGKNVLDFAFGEQTRRLVYEHLNKGIELPYEGIGVKKDGTKFYVNISGKNIVENGDKYRVSIIRDITKEKIYREKIKESEQRFRQLMEQAPFAIEVYDTDGYLREANREFESVWKLHPDELMNSYNILQSQHFKDLGVMPYIQRAFKGEVLATPDFEYDPREDGLNSDIKRWFKARMYPIYSTKNELENIVIMYEDISSQKEAEKEILSSFVKGEDKERQRIAKEIHDGLAQYLTAANLNLNSVKDNIQLDEVKMKRFDLGLDFLQQAIDESRSIAQNLMPKAIKDFGLVLALESLVKNINHSFTTEVFFYHNSRECNIDQQNEMNIYRIAQESLNNALKYAAASKIIVQLIIHKNELIFTVEDDGKGFVLERKIGHEQGLGLTNIKNRAKSMGAKLEIDSSPNKGTLIAITIPLN